MIIFKSIVYKGISLAAMILLAAGISFAGDNTSSLKVKEVEPDYAGVYKLADSTICNIVITIKKDKRGYTYKIRGSGVKNSGKLSVIKDDAEIYFVFTGTKRSGDKTAVEGAYSDGKITIQNTGNAMNQYICFKNCDAKYLEFIREK